MNESIKDRFLKEHALTDEQLKQVSGGFKDPNSGQYKCPISDECQGNLALQCPYSYCPMGYK